MTAECRDRRVLRSSGAVTSNVTGWWQPRPCALDHSVARAARQRWCVCVEGHIHQRRLPASLPASAGAGCPPTLVCVGHVVWVSVKFSIASRIRIVSLSEHSFQ